jgi:hypothetical protein
MYKKQNRELVVIYEPVIQKEQIANDGLDIAFDILFDEVLKTGEIEYQLTKDGKPETEFDSYGHLGI